MHEHVHLTVETRFNAAIETFILDEAKAYSKHSAEKLLIQDVPESCKPLLIYLHFANVAKTLPRHVWLYVRVMRLFQRHPDLDGEKDTVCRPSLLADDNGGVEDTIVDCKPCPAHEASSCNQGNRLT